MFTSHYSLILQQPVSLVEGFLHLPDEELKKQDAVLMSGSARTQMWSSLQVLPSWPHVQTSMTWDVGWRLGTKSCGRTTGVWFLRERWRMLSGRLWVCHMVLFTTSWPQTPSQKCESWSLEGQNKGCKCIHLHALPPLEKKTENTFSTQEISVSCSIYRMASFPAD